MTDIRAEQSTDPLRLISIWSAWSAALVRTHSTRPAWDRSGQEANAPRLGGRELAACLGGRFLSQPSYPRFTAPLSPGNCSLSNSTTTFCRYSVVAICVGAE